MCHTADVKTSHIEKGIWHKMPKKKGVFVNTGIVLSEVRNILIVFCLIMEMGTFK